MNDNTRAGYLLHPEGYKLLPITHVNLILDNDGISLRDELDNFQDALDLINSRIKIYTADNLQILNSINPANLKDGTMCYVVSEEKYYTYTKKNRWKEMVTSNEHEGLFTHAWIGTTPPQNKKYLWIDTTILDAKPDKVSTYPPVIKQLTNTISTLNKTILELSDRITRLENNSGSIGGGDKPGTGGNVDNNNYLLTEDENTFITEDGNYIGLETKTTTSDSSGDEGDTNKFIVSYTSSTETLNITSNSAMISEETLKIK